jgi:hypothetical protein
VREGAVDMWRHDLARRADIGFVELAVAGDSEQREANADLVFENLEERTMPSAPAAASP